MSQPQYVQPQYAPAPKKSHTVRNVFLVLALLAVLFVGGCLALVGGAINEVDKAIKADEAKEGGTNNPMPITEGEAFEVDGFNYAAGWSVKGSQFGLEIKGLKVTNNREDRDSALVEIKFMRGDEVLADADCTTSPIQVGETVTLNCLSGDKLPKQYDEITINDTF